MKQLIALINRKYRELYDLIAHSTKSNWDANVDNSGAIDEVTVDVLSKASQIKSLNESVDDIILHILKN